MRIRALFPILCVLVGTACDGPTTPERAPNGYLGVQLSGALAESYEAEGRYPGPATAPATFAAARRGTRPGVLSVGGWRSRDPGTQDALVLDLDQVAGPGVYPAAGVLTYARNGAARPVERSFRIISGEVELISTSGERLQGTFSATAVEIVPPLGPLPDTVYLSKGIFDVPVVVP